MQAEVWQLSSIARVCRSPFPQAFIPTVERLYTHDLLFGREWQGQSREHPMAGTFTSIYRCEEALRLPGIGAVIKWMAVI